MMRQSRILWQNLGLGLGLWPLACGGAPPAAPMTPARGYTAPRPAEAATPVTTPPADPAPGQQTGTTAFGAAPAEADAPAPLPKECSSADETCLPPNAFAKGLCKGKYPGLAIFMFEKSAPWERLYVGEAQLNAINSYGGPGGDASLVYGEEVLLLSKHGAGRVGGIQVSGTDDVDVLRWDGTCVTVHHGQLLDRAPGKPNNVTIVWRYLDPDIRDALLKDPKVARAHEQHKKDCKGASVNSMDNACWKATERLNQSIVDAVRAGLALPEPEKRPNWSPTKP